MHDSRQDRKHDLFVLTLKIEEQVRKMSFLRAARAALAGFPCIAAAVVLAGLSISCGSTNRLSPIDPNHNAYVTLPQKGSVVLLHINGVTGAITTGAQTPAGDGTPTGLALLQLPSKAFLYVANSFSNTISIFSVASDGTLANTTTATPAGGSSPNGMVIDPTGKYLLVTNNLSDTVSVFSIDPSTGVLTPMGSPVPANANPGEIRITPSGNAVYVTNPGIGTVTIFSFSNGVLTQLPGLSPVFSGAGASGLAVDATGRFLYVANSFASNLPLLPTIGNISGFNIDPVTGGLSPILGSPFAATTGTGPTELTIDPSGKFVYATTPGSSFSIWCFTITPANGQLVAVTNSPFSLAAGGLFALFDPTTNFFYIGNGGQSGSGINAYTYNLNTGAPTLISGSPFSIGSPPSPPGKMVLTE
jgi:6-phosphogluconolactonase